MTHPLKTYLDKHEMTETAFAERVGRHGAETKAGYVSQIIIGHRKPGGALAVAISDATGGHVSTDDLLRFEPDVKSPPKRARRSKRAAVG